jgi:hypothetical protein
MAALTTPREAFYVPTQADLNSGNPLFWQANALAIPKAMLLTFWAGATTYWAWWRYVQQFYKPNAFFDAEAAGYNDAFETAQYYLWFNDPNSPHNKQVDAGKA